MQKPGSFVLVLLLACASTGSPPRTDGVETRREAPQPAVARPMGADTAEFRVPSGDLRGDAVRGKELYDHYCSICHGPLGAGNGPTATWMNPRPTNHTDHDYMASLSDQHLYTVIQQGGPFVGKSSWMAAWGPVLPDQSIRDLIAYMRAVSGT